MRAPSAGLTAAAVLGTTVLPVRHLELLYLYGMQRGLGNRAPLGRQERTVAELQGDMTRPLITITIIKPHFLLTYCTDKWTISTAGARWFTTKRAGCWLAIKVPQSHLSERSPTPTHPHPHGSPSGPLVKMPILILAELAHGQFGPACAGAEIRARAQIYIIALREVCDTHEPSQRIMGGNR